MNQNIIRENNDFSVDYKDTCVACKGPSEENKSTNVSLRKFYVEGAGQLCRKCYFATFPEKPYSNYSNLG
jgi:hypothetical protein